MQPTLQRGFILQTVVLIAALSGWAAFAGAMFRVHDAEHELVAALEQNQEMREQNQQMREASEQLFAAQDGLARVQNEKLLELQAKLTLRENQLRKFGIPLDPPSTKP